MAEDQANAPQEESKVEPAEAPEAPKAASPKDPVAEAPKADAPEAPAADSKPAKALTSGKRYIWGTGRRKSAVARVRIRPGTGKFMINKRDATKYFVHEENRQAILAPLEAANMLKSWDVFVNVNGGGYGGQAGAVVMGLARALSKAAPEVDQALRDHGMMTRDARMKERKKPGQRGARARFQFSKR